MSISTCHKRSVQSCAAKRNMDSWRIHRASRSCASPLLPVSLPRPAAGHWGACAEAAPSRLLPLLAAHSAAALAGGLLSAAAETVSPSGASPSLLLASLPLLLACRACGAASAAAGGQSTAVKTRLALVCSRPVMSCACHCVCNCHHACEYCSHKAS